MGSPTESKILAIAPKFTAFLSICGSTFIIQKVLRSRRRRRHTMHRIMLGLSICDILASIWYFAGTWAIPAGTLSWFGDGKTQSIFWAAGDQNGVSCSVGGFFNQFAVASPLYNATLAWYFLLTVYFGWDGRRVSRIEWLFHVLPVGYALLTATFATVTNLYGHVEWTCWILPSELFDDTKDLTPVQAKFQWIQWIFLFGVVWFCVLFVTVIFVILFRKMKELETKMSRYSSVVSVGGVISSGASRSGSDGSALHSRRASDDSELRSRRLSDDSDLDSQRLSDDSDLDSQRSSAASAFANKKVSSLTAVSEGGNEDECRPEQASVRESLDVTDVAIASRTEEGVVGERFFDDAGFSECTTADKVTGADIDVEQGICIERRGGNAAQDKVNDVDNCGTCCDEEVPVHFGEKTTPRANANVRKERRSLARITWLSSYRGRTKRTSSVAGGVGESRSKQYQEHSKSRRIAIQGMLYVVAFYITWLFPTISRITELVAGTNFFIIQFFDTFLIPLQGFFNFAIYIRPRLKSYRKSNPEIGFFGALKTVLFEAD